MTLFDDLLASVRPEPPEVPWHPKPSKALGRRCRHCGDRTMRGSLRCAACAAAEYRMGGRRVPVSCWCEDTTVWVARTAIHAGLTRSCGLPECEPIAA